MLARPGILLAKMSEPMYFSYPLVLLTLFSFWMEETCSTVCLVSSNSQGSESLHWSSDQKMGQQALPQNKSGFYLFFFRVILPAYR